MTLHRLHYVNDDNSKVRKTKQKFHTKQATLAYLPNYFLNTFLRAQIMCMLFGAVIINIVLTSLFILTFSNLV